MSAHKWVTTRVTPTESEYKINEANYTIQKTIRFLLANKLQRGYMRLIFEWDEVKAHVNLKKHKVSFEEGKTIFNDPFLFTFQDERHSANEERYINIGLSANGRILILTHSERQGKIRIISCRKATPRERSFYEEVSF